MKKSKGLVESNLRNLYKLQLIDSRIDSIHLLTGELPAEIKKLEIELSNLREDMEKKEQELKDDKVSISARLNTIKDSEKLIQKYEEQQKQVRNNREYNSLSKEIEYQQIEIQINQKKIKELGVTFETREQEIIDITEVLKANEEHLNKKRQEISEISSESEEELKFIHQELDKQRSKVNEDLLSVYDTLRKNCLNGLAVVPVENGISMGSFIQVPPQIALEIGQRNTIIFDEHSGKILVDEVLGKEENKKITKIFKKIQTQITEAE